MKQILLLHFACEVSEQLIEQILAKFVGPLLQFDVGGGQRLTCIVGRILVCGEIFGFNILLRLIEFCFKFQISLLYYRCKEILVGHAQCSNLTECPIGGKVVAHAAGTIRISFIGLCSSLIERDEYA